jgi:hypothetical protein
MTYTVSPTWNLCDGIGHPICGFTHARLDVRAAYRNWRAPWPVAGFGGPGLATGWRRRDQLNNAATSGLVRRVWGNGLVCLAFALYRERAAEAKDRAAQARDPFIKSAFENVAAGWVALAEQVERIDREKFSLRDEEK